MTSKRFLALILMSALASCAPEAAPPAPPSPYGALAKADMAERAKNAAPEVSLPAWVQESQKRYQQVLAGQVKGGTLVLPFAVDTVPAERAVSGFAGGGIDLSGRMVMAQLLAQRLAANGERVADPAVVDLALGEARAWAFPLQIAKLAQTTGAARVVVGKATWRSKTEGMELRRELDISIDVYNVREESGNPTLVPEKQRYQASGVPISGAAPPEAQFAALIPKIGAQLGLALEAPALKHQEGTGAFPPTPREAAVRRDALTVDDLWVAALVAGLYRSGDGSERARQRAHERLLAAVDRLSPSLQDRRLLQARAYAALERREAALAVLGAEDGSPEGVALRAYLDGNLPALEAAAAKIQRPIPRLLAELDRFSIAWTYELIERGQLAVAGQRILALAPEGWHPLVAWHLLARDRWSVREPLESALFLEQSFPLDGENLESLVRGKLALGRADAAELNAIAAKHAARVVHARARDFCCTGRAGLASDLDLVLLLEDEALARTLKQVEFLGRVQGRHADAVRLAEELERTALRGQPDLVLERIYQLTQLNPALRNEQSPARNQLIAELAAVHGVLAWQGQQSEFVRQQLGQFSAATVIRRSPWVSDFPGRWYWTLRNPETNFPGEFPGQMAPDGQISLARWRRAILIHEACAATIVWIDPCSTLHSLEMGEKRTDREKAALREIQTRFIGSFHRVQRLADLAAYTGNEKGEVDEYQRDIAQFPDRWAAYDALAKLQLARGSYADAANAALKYPAFSDASRSFTVDLSNRLYEVGYGLVLRGAVDEAKPLLKIGAAYRDGSSANLWARYQLAVIEGRELEALETLAGDARNYKAPGALRKYASMLFMFGESKTGWAVFEEGRRLGPQFNVWRAAAVGLRADGADTEAVLKWVAELGDKRDGAADLPAGIYRFNIGIQALAVDRSGDGLAKLADMETRGRMPGGSGAELERFLAIVRENPGERSSIATVADGYAAFKRKDYAAAYEGLKWLVLARSPTGAVGPSPAVDPGARAGLPYLAFAAVKTGNAGTVSDALEAFHGRLNEDDRKSFDRALVNAVFAALGQRHEEAGRWVRLARANMAEPDQRPLPPEYVYAEILEALAADTGRTEYLEVALDWARRSQRYEPFAAWAYAFEARHSPVGRDRTRALAIALHLDPRSARLAQIDARSKEQARAWFKAKDPIGINRVPRGAKPEQAT